MRTPNESGGPRQYTKYDNKSHDLYAGPMTSTAVSGTMSPTTMQVSSSSSNKAPPFSHSHRGRPAHFHTQLHTGAAATLIDQLHAPHSQHPHEAAAASGHSESGSFGLGEDDDVVDDDIDDSSCMPFETTINGDQSMRSIASRFSQASDANNWSLASNNETEHSNQHISPASWIRIAPADEQSSDSSMDEDDESDDIFDSPIPALGRPKVNKPFVSIGSTTTPLPASQSHNHNFHTAAPLRAQTFGVYEPSVSRD